MTKETTFLKKLEKRQCMHQRDNTSLRQAINLLFQFNNTNQLKTTKAKMIISSELRMILKNHYKVVIATKIRAVNLRETSQKSTMRSNKR
jgi:hypothetical protein